jgi:hypothetical protein
MTGLGFSIMQEVLSKTNDPKAPLQGQEFYELRLFEEPNQLTASGRLTHSGATGIGMSFGKAKRQRNDTTSGSSRSQ